MTWRSRIELCLVNPPRKKIFRLNAFSKFIGNREIFYFWGWPNGNGEIFIFIGVVEY
jgi:hypothetical protein